MLWWEVRRIPYNLIVGLAGAVSLISTFFLIIASGTLEPGEDAIEPVAWIGLPLIGGVFFNVCYTAGSVLELVVRAASGANNRYLGPILLTGGLVLSLAIVSVPVVSWAAYDVITWLFG